LLTLLATQAALHKEGDELMVIACEIKCKARRGVYVVKTHGQYNVLGKLVALVARSSINKQFDKVKTELHFLLHNDTLTNIAPGPALPPGETYTGVVLRDASKEKASSEAQCLAVTAVQRR
jgi:hypothetical protein